MEQMKLLDVCDFRGGSQPPKEEWISEERPGYVRMLQIRDFTQGSEKFVQFVPDTGKLRKCGKDDLLLCRYGYIGQVVTGLEGAYNVALVKVERKHPIYQPYLMYYFQSPYFRNYLLSNTGARATIAGFNMNELHNALIPIPSEAIQQKIAARLTQVDHLISERQAQIEAFPQLLKAHFHRLFAEGGQLVRVQDLCSHIVDCPHSTPKYDGDLKYPAIRTTDIKDGYIDRSQMKYVSEAEYEKRTARFTPQAGDIVYSREGTCGNAALLPEGQSFCLGQRVMLFRPHRELCVPEYLLHCLISEQVWQQVCRRSVGSIVPHLNMRDAKNLMIRLHPLPKQESFAHFARQLSDARQTAIAALTELKELKTSLLKDYYG